MCGQDARDPERTESDFSDEEDIARTRNAKRRHSIRVQRHAKKIKANAAKAAVKDVEMAKAAKAKAVKAKAAKVAKAAKDAKTAKLAKMLSGLNVRTRLVTVTSP